MAEPVIIDSLPVELTAEQQELWDTGHKPTVRKQIREERLAVQKPVEDMTSAPSFNEVMGE